MNIIPLELPETLTPMQFLRLWNCMWRLACGKGSFARTDIHVFPFLSDRVSEYIRQFEAATYQSVDPQQAKNPTRNDEIVAHYCLVLDHCVDTLRQSTMYSAAAARMYHFLMSKAWITEPRADWAACILATSRLTQVHCDIRLHTRHMRRVDQE